MSDFFEYMGSGYDMDRDSDLPTDDGWNDLEPLQRPPEFDTREEEAREG